MGNRACYQSMQVHGGVGYMKEFNIERLFRDVESRTSTKARASCRLLPPSARS
jgi:alkylation response protein AidB-like acyl-CoA dehydrogenase